MILNLIHFKQVRKPANNFFKSLHSFLGHERVNYNKLPLR